MKLTLKQIQELKGHRNISMITSYDTSMARIVNTTAVDLILVGDSLGMVVLGYANTLSVTMDDMLRATGAVCRGAPGKFVIADMPIHSYDDPTSAILNAEALIKTGADAVKIENRPDIAAFLVKQNIPVMGHIGLTPQSITNMKVQGKDDESAQKLLAQAKELEQAGVFCLVLECVPTSLAKKLTASVKIPTIGIGAGPEVDGQVLVINDMLGLNPDFNPKFLKTYEQLFEKAKRALDTYVTEVHKKKFPEDKHSFH